MTRLGNQTFIDGVGDVRVQDGIVRIDLLALSPTGVDKDGNPNADFVSQMVMSPAAFLRMVSAIGNTVSQMQEKGMLGEAPAAVDKPAEKKPAAKKAASKKPAAKKPAVKKPAKKGKSTARGRSPNF